MNLRYNLRAIPRREIDTLFPDNAYNRSAFRVRHRYFAIVRPRARELFHVAYSRARSWRHGEALLRAGQRARAMKNGRRRSRERDNTMACITIGSISFLLDTASANIITGLVVLTATGRTIVHRETRIYLPWRARNASAFALRSDSPASSPPTWEGRRDRDA